MKLQTFFFTSRSRPLCQGLTAGSSKRLFSTLILTALLLLETAPVFAKPPEAVPVATADLSSHLPAQNKAPPSGPSWNELTPEQQQALSPLASDWSGISEPQKRKWLEISKNYRALTPAKKAKLSSRMTQWAALSPQQRAQARLNFGKTKELARQLTPEEKNDKWKAYQALSPEEKKKLAAKASPKRSGAATAVKPVPPQKLAAFPLPADGSKPVLKPEPKSAPKIIALPSATPPATLAPASTAH